MKSFDFDDLLRDVLQEDARVEPCDGFEARVLSRLLAETPSASRKGIFWAALAACAVAAGLLVWVRAAPELRYAILNASSAGLPNPFTGDAGRGDKSLDQGQQTTAGSLHAVRKIGLQRAKSKGPTHQKQLKLLPIAINSLVVRPLEIASLKPERETKGEIQ